MIAIKPKTDTLPPEAKRHRIICPKISKMQQETDFYGNPPVIGSSAEDGLPEG
jgi:hypothetical protein